VRRPGDTIKFSGYRYSKYIQKTPALLDVRDPSLNRGKMKAAPLTEEGDVRQIDYKTLRRFSAVAACRVVVEYIKTKLNILETARLFGIFCTSRNLEIRVG
jgi:hypothetical protein